MLIPVNEHIPDINSIILLYQIFDKFIRILYTYGSTCWDLILTTIMSLSNTAVLLAALQELNGNAML